MVKHTRGYMRCLKYREANRKNRRKKVLMFDLERWTMMKNE